MRPSFLPLLASVLLLSACASALEPLIGGDPAGKISGAVDDLDGTLTGERRIDSNEFGAELAGRLTGVDPGTGETEAANLGLTLGRAFRTGHYGYGSEGAVGMVAGAFDPTTGTAVRMLYGDSAVARTD